MTIFISSSFSKRLFGVAGIALTLSCGISNAAEEIGSTKKKEPRDYSAALGKVQFPNVDLRTVKQKCGPKRAAITLDDEDEDKDPRVFYLYTDGLNPLDEKWWEGARSQYLGLYGKYSGTVTIGNNQITVPKTLEKQLFRIFSLDASGQRGYYFLSTRPTNEEKRQLKEWKIAQSQTELEKVLKTVEDLDVTVARLETLNRQLKENVPSESLELDLALEQSQNDGLRMEIVRLTDERNRLETFLEELAFHGQALFPSAPCEMGSVISSLPTAIPVAAGPTASSVPARDASKAAASSPASSSSTAASAKPEDKTPQPRKSPAPCEELDEVKKMGLFMRFRKNLEEMEGLENIFSLKKSCTFEDQIISRKKLIFCTSELPSSLKPQQGKVLLKFLDATENQFTWVTEISLNLKECSDIQKVMDKINEMSRLKKILLKLDAPLAFPYLFEGMQNLQVLDLSGNTLTDMDLSRIKKFIDNTPNLKEIKLWNERPHKLSEDIDLYFEKLGRV